MSRRIPLTLLLTLILSLAAAPDALAKKPRVRHSPETTVAAAPGGYLTRDLTGPNGERVPIMEVPGSATVINRQILDDQQATTLGQALRNVSGVTVRH
jgi:outer membrane receptor for ferric coprogen and ferric-rhodotorulic acid